MIFGQLTDLTGTSNILLKDVNDTDHALLKLHDLFPGLGTVRYACAVDKHIISENTMLKDDSTIALLPPFSGG